MNGKPQDRYPYQASPEAASQQPPTRAANRQGLPSPFRHLQHLLLPLLLGWGAMATAQELGTTPGELSVNSGAASYTIPIAVPPGVAGMEPALSLVVDTSGRNGLAGLGGSIDGLSVISRCPASIDVDGHAGSIALDRSDHFCLDGQRLILATGTQSRHGSLYQPEVTNLSRVEAKGNAGEGPAWFEVRTKAGLRMQYGSTTNARVKGAQQSEIIAWAVNRIQDTLGNAIEFTYHANHYAGEHYPVRVSYGGNSVEFLYEEHPIHLIGYGLGLSQIRTQRLSSVQVRAGGKIVRSYQLSYAPADDLSPSRLTEVSLCDAANRCLRPVKFAWGGQDAVGNALRSDSLDVGNRNDFFLEHEDTGLLPSSYWNKNHPRSFGDFNGDGQLDLVGFSKYGVQIALGNETGAFSGSQTTPYFPLSSERSGWGKIKNDRLVHPLLLGDVNGDGLTDVVGGEGELCSGWPWRLGHHQSTSNFPAN